MPARERLRLQVLSSTGMMVKTLAEEIAPAGALQRTWDDRDERGRSLTPGIYFARLTCAGQSLQQKLVLLE